MRFIFQRSANALLALNDIKYWFASLLGVLFLKNDGILILKWICCVQTIKARVKAVMNDTVGQLAASAYKYGKDCVIGVVIGYGCNASYVEDVKEIKKFDAVKSGYAFKHMVVDTEWEEFGIKGELSDIITSFDKEVDDNSVHKGKQMYVFFIFTHMV